LERIEPLIAAQGQPQQAQPNAESQAASLDAAPVEQNTVAERERTEQADAVKSKLSCNSDQPLVDGRPLVMAVVRQGEKLRVTLHAVNGPGDVDTLLDALFTQNDEGHWVSYEVAPKTEATVIFNDNYGNVGQYIRLSLMILKYDDNTKLYTGDGTSVLGKCYKVH
jgi:hypothetical protein